MADERANVLVDNTVNLKNEDSPFTRVTPPYLNHDLSYTTSLTNSKLLLNVRFLALSHTSFRREQGQPL